MVGGTTYGRCDLWTTTSLVTPGHSGRRGTLPHGKRLAPAIVIRLADKLHQTVSLLQEVLQQRASVFREELGTLKDYKAVIRVDPSVLPKFCKARSVPYALRAKVDQELDQLVAEGILEPVQYAELAAPIVPVLKSDQSVRICGDFKQTVNKASSVDRYPLPKGEDLFATLSGGQIFSKLDLSQA